VGRAQQLPDAAGEVALEAPDRFAMGLAFCLLARDELERLLMAARAGDSDAANRRVDLTVAAAIETMPVGPT
jgi:hypothetical protein